MATNDSKISFDQPRSTFGTWLGIVLLFVIFGVFVWVVMGAMPRGDDYEQKRSQARLEKLKTAREEYAKATQGYAWVDKQKGVARIPVERAMEVAMADLAQRKPMPANPIEPGAGDKVGQQASAPDAPPSAPEPPKPKEDSTPRATAITGPGSENNNQPAAAANPPPAAPGTQPGANATPAASPGSAATQPGQGVGNPGPTPEQKAPGPNLPVPGKDPLPTATPQAPKQP